MEDALATRIAELEVTAPVEIDEATKKLLSSTKSRE